MVLAGVVHDEVQAYADALLPTGVRQPLQVLHGPQLRLDGAEVADGVAPVAAPLGRLQQGHEVQVIHPALLQIRQLFLHAPQVPGESAGVEHHAQYVPAAVPAGVLLPVEVLIPEGPLAVPPGAAEHLQERFISFGIAVVKFTVEPFQFIAVPGQAAVKSGLFCHKCLPFAISILLFPN